MRRIKPFIAASLAGYIARPDGGFDWWFTDGDDGYRELYGSIDTVAMGRQPCELSLRFDEYPNPGSAALSCSRRRAGEGNQHAEFGAARLRMRR